MRAISAPNLAGSLRSWPNGSEPAIVGSSIGRPAMMVARNTYDRNPLREAERFVDGGHFQLDATLRRQVVEYIAKRFLQVADQKMDSVFAHLRDVLRDPRGRPLVGYAVIERLRSKDTTDANNQRAFRNISGAAVSVTMQMAADLLALVGKMLIAPPPEVTLTDPGATQRYRQQSAALDEAFAGAGEAAARFVGADPNSELYRQGKSAAELALLIGGVLKLAPGTITLARRGADIVLISRDVKAFERAADNPELLKKLAITISNRDSRAIDSLPPKLQVQIRKILKEWPDNQRATRGLANMPTTPTRTALVTRIAGRVYVSNGDRLREFGYRIGPDHYIKGSVQTISSVSPELLAAVRKGGVGQGAAIRQLTFEFRANSKYASQYGGGADMFNATMQQLKAKNIRVDVITARWENSSNLGDNYKAFMRLRSMGLSVEQAALRTPTGQLAAAHGYKHVVFSPAVLERTQQRFVTINFTK